MCKHPKLVTTVAVAWGTGAQVNLTGWGLVGLKLILPLHCDLVHRKLSPSGCATGHFHWCVAEIVSSIIQQWFIAFLKKLLKFKDGFNDGFSSKQPRHEPQTGE